MRFLYLNVKVLSITNNQRTIFFSVQVDPEHTGKWPGSSSLYLGKYGIPFQQGQSMQSYSSNSLDTVSTMKIDNMESVDTKPLVT